MKKNIIQFIPSSEETSIVVPHPKPAKNYMPDWYKEIANPLHNGSVGIDENGALENTNLKMCMPFLDTLTSGYIQETWCDIYFSQENNNLLYRYTTQPEILSIREKSDLNVGQEYYNSELIWKTPWITKTPPGWSSLIVHPLNRFDLPFFTVSGIIDTDKFNHSSFGALPFYVKSSFQGIIPAGTPMFQIIPFERSKWVSEIKEFNNEVNRKKFHDVKRKFFGFYKHEMWVKKTYK